MSADYYSCSSKYVRVCNISFFLRRFNINLFIKNAAKNHVVEDFGKTFLMQVYFLLVRCVLNIRYYTTLTSELAQAKPKLQLISCS